MAKSSGGGGRAGRGLRGGLEGRATRIFAQKRALSAERTALNRELTYSLNTPRGVEIRKQLDRVESRLGRANLAWAGIRRRDVNLANRVAGTNFGSIA